MYHCNYCNSDLGFPHEPLACVSVLRAKLAEAEKRATDAEKKLPCGHPLACEEDDQCCLPEHRYCGYCHALDCNKVADWQKAAEKFMDERDAALKRLAEAEERVKAFERALAPLKSEIGEAAEVNAAWEAVEMVAFRYTVGTNSTIQFKKSPSGDKAS